ncbi:hypothetical protein D3C71_1833920 [compost metagenome]
MPSQNRMPGLALRVRRGVHEKILGELELWTLFRSRAGVKILGEPTFEYQSAIDSLVLAGLVTFDRRDLQLTSEGRLFLAWLLRVGFSFDEIQPALSVASAQPPPN